MVYDNDNLLINAARKGDLSKVEELLREGSNINAKNDGGYTSLHLAARYSHSNVVEKLLDKGADINAENNDGLTPLELAKKYDKLEVVSLLRKKQQEKPVQRKRRHHSEEQRYMSSAHLELEGTGRSVENDNPTIENNQATSGISKPSLWINDLFSWTKEKGSLLVSGVVNSVWPASMAKLSEETSTTKNNLEPIYYSQIDINGTILLLDTSIRKITGQKYISTVDQSMSPLEAQGYVLNIIEEFEKVVEQAGLKSGVSIHRLNIDYMGMQKEIARKIMAGKFNEISGVLKSYIEKGCPGEEAGKLSPKKFDKFIAQFNKGLLNQSIEHNGDGRLEVNNVKEQQEPKSCLNNTSIQGHLTRDKVKLIS
ncbi:ankyrin repeat domain-containing protein [Wolbachia endosymbiont (group B) of Erebia ligea]|uniref:ankyrin repeat domain-containing protein n=1 Tax=Wolbachia endosymbiont (group B) of Erebia ligea TaxID=2954010 RepID=UPI0021F8A58E|nr:ankyrin repeat domain-containing protein [Wolbachia endosymbiont (group B) of Erebia ligea]